MTEAVVIAIIAGIFASIPGVWSLMAQRRKSKADVADTYQDIAGRAAEDLQKALEETRRQREEIKGLAARVTLLEHEKETLVKERAELIGRVAMLEKENIDLRETVEQLQLIQGLDPKGV